MRRWLPHIGVAFGLSLAGYALFFGSTDEDKIRALLDDLEVAVQVNESETNLIIRGSRIKKAFSTIFTKDITFQIPDLNSGGGKRKELVMLAAQAPRLYRTAVVDLDGLNIKIDQSASSATAFGDANLIGVRQGGQSERDQRTVSLRLDKIDGDWRIIRMDVSGRGGAPKSADEQNEAQD